MTFRRRPRPTLPVPPKVLDPAAPPSLYNLDSFSRADIERWRKTSRLLDELYRELYFGLESQRVALRSELLEALRSKASRPLDFSGWYRQLEYQYCLEPLSARGSVTRYGGRFNVGAEVGAGAFEAFPALYIAEDLETAFREFFQAPATTKQGGLTVEDFALKRPGGMASAEVHGHLEVVFDIADSSALRPFVDLIATFKMPPRVTEIARQLKMPRASLIRTGVQLQRSLSVANWRAWPVQFDVPSNSQVMGGLICDAGFEAILYPSSKNGRRCLALFPANLQSSDSFVALTGEYPHQVKEARLDSETAENCV